MLSTKKLMCCLSNIGFLKFGSPEKCLVFLTLLAQMYCRSNCTRLIGSKNLKRVLYFSITSGENMRCRGQCER